jgi:uncharacterized protein YoxC
MTLTSVFYILLLIAATGLCVALVIYLNRITKTIKELEKDVRNLTAEIRPLIESTLRLSEKLYQLSEDAKEPVQTAKTIIENVKNHVDKILELEEKIRGGIEDSVTGLIRNLSAVVNGVSTFWKAYKKK